MTEQMAVGAGPAKLHRLQQAALVLPSPPLSWECVPATEARAKVGWPPHSSRPLSMAMRALHAVGLRRELEEPRARSGAA